MLVFLPLSLEEAFDAFEQCPDAHFLAGGTDFMVEVNFALRRPPAVVCLRKVEELHRWRRDGSDVVLGAGITYTELMAPQLGDLLPGLAQASRTVGSPQIRNAGTLGGNLGTASPAGDSLPVLAALDARIILASRNGRRDLGLEDLIVGPKRTTLQPGEIIVAVRLPAPLGSQEFLKVGTRNAMVIAVANVALVVDWAGRTVRCALGSVGPVVIRAHEAEAFISSRIDWEAPRLPHDGDLAEFTALVRAAARPIDDHRSTADYRRHAVGVCAYRALERVFTNLNGQRWARIVGELIDYQLRINGREHDVAEAWLGESLLYVLRERLGLPGSKNACEQGECGSCSVLMDGKLVCSCMVLAASAVGADIVTVEGLAGGEGVLSGIQAAFLAEGGVQCGFCTPGFVVSVHDLLEHNPDPTELEVREAVSGNLCRCTGYGRILAAVQAAQKARQA